LGILISESHNLNVISELNCWLGGSVHRLTIKFSFKYVLVWTELEPLWIPWVVLLNNIPVYHTSGEVSSHKSVVVVHQPHLCCNVLNEECVWVPDPELILISLDVFLEVALSSWELNEIL